MKNYSYIFLAFMAVVFSTSAADAQYSSGKNRDYRRYEDSRYNNNRYGNNWMKISRTRISPRDGYARINVSRRYANVHQLMFKTDGSVNIYRVMVRYTNGQTRELRVGNNGRNNRNRWNNEIMVSVPDGGRNAELREIRYWYNAGQYSRRNSRSGVLVFAR